MSRLRLLLSVSSIVLAAVFAAGCRVPTDSVVARAEFVAPTSSLPAIGPVPASSHWHAAYVVRVCDDVLAPFDSTDDPLGIHSHADGIIHIHPFFEASGYEQATMGLFADAMGFELSDGELTLPGGGTWRDGDLCGTRPGRVFVDRWSEADPATPTERIFEGLEELRFRADGELYQIAFAPEDSAPVVPPSAALLPEVSNLAPAPEPWVDLGPLANDPSATGTLAVWVVGQVAEPPCSVGSLPERVLDDQVRCFRPAGEALTGAQSARSARAVQLNRRPAVELVVAPPLRQLIDAHFASTEDPLTLAIEFDGAVVQVAQLVRPPLGERLVIAGGMTESTAIALAALLNG